MIWGLGGGGVIATVFPSASLENEVLSSHLCSVLEEVCVFGSALVCNAL